MSTPRGPADMAEAILPQQPELSVERVTELDDHDMAELCEATDAAIIEGGGFGWVEPQGRAALQRHFRGVLLVPELDELVGVALRDGVVDDNEKRVLGSIIARLTPADLTPEMQSRIAELRVKYAL